MVIPTEVTGRLSKNLKITTISRLQAPFNAGIKKTRAKNNDKEQEEDKCQSKTIEYRLLK